MAVTRNPCRYCASSYYDARTGRRIPNMFTEVCSKCEWIDEHKKYLKSKRKFTEGEIITTLDELLEQEWVMWFHSTRHIEVIKSVQLRTVLKWLKLGAIRKAIKKEEKER